MPHASRHDLRPRLTRAVDAIFEARRAARRRPDHGRGIWPVAMPISAPKPNSPPSANCVEALCSTIAESTSLRNLLAAASSALTIASVWCEPWFWICAIALVDTVHHLRRDDRVEIFGVPIVFAGSLDARIGLLHGVVAAALRSRPRSASRPAASGFWRRRRDRPAASRPRRRRRCGASWR